MLDRQYFETVLPEQIRSIGSPCRLTVHMQSGAEYDVASVFALHETYLVFDLHAPGEEPKRSVAWQAEHPDASPWVFDQVAVSYHNIVAAYLTPKGAGSETDTSIGFRLSEPIPTTEVTA